MCAHSGSSGSEELLHVSVVSEFSSSNSLLASDLDEIKFQIIFLPCFMFLFSLSRTHFMHKQHVAKK